jgi:hypothetical protein
MERRFPQVTGSSLDRKRFNLPEDFSGEVNIVLIAFQQWQQSVVDTWLPLLQEIETRYEGVRYYELPVIQRYNRLAQFYINEGMRAGIPDWEARARTITLYVDKLPFRQALDLSSESEIYVLAVERTGRVLWSEQGPYLPHKGATLMKLLETAQARG